MKNLAWLKEGQQYQLKHEEALLLTLHIYHAVSADFILNEIEYKISTRGAWNPSWYVTANGIELLKVTHSFWSSKGKILFSDGTEYSVEYTSKGGYKMQLMDGGVELLSYGVAFENKRPIMVFTLGSELIDAERLLILAALGMTLFSGVFGEMSCETDNTSFALLATTISYI